jgi:hypothetical protein
MSNQTKQNKTYYGKYRGTVMNNVDLEQRGRLQLEIPDVLGAIPSSWAEPCVPLSGPTGPAMGVYMVPPIGSGVWVEFEQGDPDRPVWTGCRFDSSSSVPSQATLGNPADPNIVIQSFLQHMIVISDMPPTPVTGGILLQSTTGAKILVNDSGIYIDNGLGASIKLIGPSVMINDSALVVI